MTLEIIPIGGFSEVGRNCCAVKVDDEIVILDMGLMLDKYIEYTESSEDVAKISAKKLIEVGAIPDVNILGNQKKNVVGIIISHGHFDHVAGIPWLANRFDADIHGTPMTCEVVKNLTMRDRRPIKNRIVSHGVNSKFKLTRKIEVEFIHMTHSIPQTVAVVLHTKYGSIAYLNDFKLDASPTLGPRTNLERIKELRGIKAVILDALYADVQEKAPSERIAEQMLFDQLLNTNTDKKTVIVTTFGSHIARIQSIKKLAQKMNRKLVIMGRSMDKWISAAENAKIAQIKKGAIMLPYRAKVDEFLRRQQDLSKYLLLMTGHQGEPKAVLSRTLNKGLLRLGRDDLVVFSSHVIPVEVCIENRKKLEDHLRHNHIRIFTDIHVSGHGAREDHRDLLSWMRPQHLIPVHGDMKQLGAMRELAVNDMKYRPENVHILYNGQRLELA